MGELSIDSTFELLTLSTLLTTWCTKYCKSAQRRGDKRHRQMLGLLKSGRRKNLPLPHDLYRLWDYLYLFTLSKHTHYVRIMFGCWKICPVYRRPVSHNL